MGLIGDFRRRRKVRKHREERVSIMAALSEAHRAAERRPITVEDRVVIFSDLHKGARDGADDFQRCERAYNAALTYYHHLGWHLVELGDVEELWENTFEEVAGSYPETLRIAAAFQQADPPRYTRLYGNHDLAWRDEKLFGKLMAPHGYERTRPLGSLVLSVTDRDGSSLGDLLLVHGHQGTGDSDRRATTSRFFVKRAWRPLQAFLNRPWNTPSVDWELRGFHARTMEAWATEHHQVLIAGHTHQPVFFNQRNQPDPPPESMDPDTTGDPRVAEALRRARAAWAAAERVRRERQRPVEMKTPCYFNTGGCSFGDGDITGIEIADGEIRLIRWPADADTDRRVLGQPLRLADVFAVVRGDR